jgi:hypothetical protein
MNPNFPSSWQWRRRLKILGGRAERGSYLAARRWIRVGTFSPCSPKIAR